MSYLTDPFAVPEQLVPAPAPRARAGALGATGADDSDGADAARPRAGRAATGGPASGGRHAATTQQRDATLDRGEAEETNRRDGDAAGDARDLRDPRDASDARDTSGASGASGASDVKDDAGETHDGGETNDARPAPVVLTSPAGGIPEVVEDEHRLLEAAEALAAGHGPLAIDAERASGYRYGQRAYLVQVRREGSGTWLLDPVGCPDLEPVQRATDGVEWILHAATQDLGCLRGVGLSPTSLFDTELGARLAGLPRVGLAAVLEHYLDVSLAKEHSAVDWSTRPLPRDWLNYAALDVECLAAVREAMIEDLAAQGKLEWARQEFEALTSFTGHATRPDPWRRVSGMRRLRSPRAAAVLRELWYTRDDLARDRDVSPGRIVPDSVLGVLATATPRTAAEVTAASTHRTIRRHPEVWAKAVTRALDLPESDLPPTTLPSTGPPAPRSWADKDPVAAARLAAAKDDLTAFAEEHRLPLENVLTPDTLRRVVWTPPEQHDEGTLHDALTALGARRWQADIAAPVLARAFATAQP
ncbi:HRDC domain-containing protein [Mobilicoccus sp.]|uniref:HRDC domain-containing protein n=1 Tax=Mobilicoccus sp. TaxID=2034349 RepID=UPI00289D7D56|nr:HRDC domain-containing protein [Mobilicoccus sp.]